MWPFGTDFCHVIFLLSFFSIIAILVSIKCYIIVFFICISLKTNDTEHLFICLWPICISFFRDVLYGLTLKIFNVNFRKMCILILVSRVFHRNHIFSPLSICYFVVVVILCLVIFFWTNSVMSVFFLICDHCNLSLA